MENDPVSPTSRDLALIPERYPFIVSRREAFGGLLFNRYLSFVELDPLQAGVIERCDGCLTQAEIAEQIGRELSIDPSRAFQQVQTAFDKFDSHFALKWNKTQKSTASEKISTHSTRPRPASPALSAPLYVLWDITYACNLRCKHCLTESGGSARRPKPLRLETVKQVLDQMVDMQIFYVNFVGGEPFVRADMLDILDYASSLPIGVIVTTNGSLVDDALVERLQGLNIFDIQVSLDGLKKTHDDFRGLPGAFEKTRSAIQKLTRAGFRVTINTVMTRPNRHELERLIDLAIELQATTYKAVAFLPVGRGKQNSQNLQLAPAQLRQNILRLKELAQKLEGIIHIEYEENYPFELEPSPPACGQISQRQLGCAAGLSQLVIDPYGKVFACPFLHDIPAGDLDNQSLAEIWLDSYILGIFRNIEKEKLEGKCRDCAFAGSECRGGCRAAAYAVSGSFWAEDPLCWHFDRRPLTVGS